MFAANQSGFRLALSLVLSLALHALSVACFLVRPEYEPSGTAVLNGLEVFLSPRGETLGHEPRREADALQSTNPARPVDLAASKTADGGNALLREERELASGSGPQRGVAYYVAARTVPFPYIDAAASLNSRPGFVERQERLPALTMPDLGIGYPERAKGIGRKASISVAVATDEKGEVVDAAPLDDDPDDRLFSDAVMGAIRKQRFPQTGVDPRGAKFVVVVLFGYE